MCLSCADSATVYWAVFNDINRKFGHDSWYCTLFSVLSGLGGIASCSGVGLVILDHVKYVILLRCTTPPLFLSHLFNQYSNFVGGGGIKLGCLWMISCKAFETHFIIVVLVMFPCIRTDNYLSITEVPLVKPMGDEFPSMSQRLKCFWNTFKSYVGSNL